MKIRTKTIALVGLVVLVLGSAVYAVNTLQARASASETERAEVTASLQRACSALNDRLEGLRSVAGDLAPWDDTYRFMKDHDQGYIDSNLTDATLVNLQVDFIVFTDTEGRIAYAKVLDPKTAKPIPIPQALSSYLGTQPSLLHQKPGATATAGVVALAGGPIAIAAAPITTTDMKSPSGGTLLTGLFLTQARVEAISTLTLTPLSISQIEPGTSASATGSPTERLLAGNDVVVIPRDSLTVDGFGLFPGISGPPALALRVTMPRTATVLGEQGVANTGLSVLALFVGLVGTLWLVVDRTVLRPLSALATDVDRVGNSSDPGERLSVAGNDEIAVVARTINSTLKRLQQSDYLATHDALTGLNNRQSFEEAMERDIAEASRFGESGSVLWLDIDHFKEINDTLGHRVGDQLLMQFARLLLDETRSYGVTARLGGDEFGVLLPHSDSPQSAKVADRLLTALSAHVFEIDSHQLRASASIGVITYPSQGDRVDQILARADLAMYAAKEAGRNSLQVYSEDADAQTLMAARITGAEQILRAVQEGRLVLHAQSMLNMNEGGAVGPVELLVRMVADDGSLVAPNDFIPIAEHLGIVRDIDRWVARTAITMLAEEKAAGRDTTFCVNLSGTAFSDQELLGLVRSELARTGANASSLIFEITETAAIRDIHKARRFIEELRALGCRFSLDDFGTGMSSFYYLKQLPIDLLKIDGSLVRHLDVTDEDSYFVRAIIEMCRGLGIPTVAEYVESAGLLEIVREMGIDYAQGFHVGRPAPWGPGAGQGARG